MQTHEYQIHTSRHILYVCLVKQNVRSDGSVLLLGDTTRHILKYQVETIFSPNHRNIIAVLKPSHRMFHKQSVRDPPHTYIGCLHICHYIMASTKATAHTQGPAQWNSTEHRATQSRTPNDECAKKHTRKNVNMQILKSQQKSVLLWKFMLKSVHLIRNNISFYVTTTATETFFCIDNTVIYICKEERGSSPLYIRPCCFAYGFAQWLLIFLFCFICVRTHIYKLRYTMNTIWV